jgi:uncharacterized protein (TIGR02996 family)
MSTEPDRPARDADEDALVRAVLADPYDTLARNVYADWLEDHARPHHAELARHPTKGNDQRVDVDGPFQDARATAPRPAVRLIHRSGFLAAQMPIRDFLSKQFQEAGAAWLRANHVTWLELESAPDFAKVAASPALAAVRGLRVLRGIGRPAGLSPMAGLLALWPSTESIPEGWMGELAKCEGLKGLLWLTLPRDYRPNAEALQTLATGPLASGLRYLDLSGTMLSADSAALLLLPPLADSLVTLRLVRCGLGEKTTKALAESPHFARLRNLDLRANFLREEGTAALARWPHLPRLVRLSLSKPPYSGEMPLEALRAALGHRLIVE